HPHHHKPRVAGYNGYPTTNRAVSAIYPTRSRLPNTDSQNTTLRPRRASDEQAAAHCVATHTVMDSDGLEGHHSERACRFSPEKRHATDTSQEPSPSTRGNYQCMREGK